MSEAQARLDTLLQILHRFHVVELGFPLDESTPHLPSHPPLMHGLIRRHGDLDLGDDVSAAADIVTLGLHTGTHLDAVGHVSRAGRLHGGMATSGTRGDGRLAGHGIDEIAPFVGRGVLLDIAEQRGVPRLEATDVVSAKEIEACAAASRAEVRKGDAVLVRTGWPRYRGDRERFAGRDGAPGVGADAARWLAERGAALVGADTPAFEPLPSHGIPAHVELLVRHGIPILEFLDLEALAAANVEVFLLIAVPLRISGGTASPMRPLALVPRSGHG